MFLGQIRDVGIWWNMGAHSNRHPPSSKNIKVERHVQHVTFNAYQRRDDWMCTSFQLQSSRNGLPRTHTSWSENEVIYAPNTLKNLLLTQISFPHSNCNCSSWAFPAFLGPDSLQLNHPMYPIYGLWPHEANSAAYENHSIWLLASPMIYMYIHIYIYVIYRVCISYNIIKYNMI